MGSVVLLKNAKKRVMICGWFPQTKDGKTFDYTGCMFPEGIIDSEKMLLFNDEDIESLFFIGMQDFEQMNYVKQIRAAVEKKEGTTKDET